jgi:phosphoglycerate kinase
MGKSKVEQDKLATARAFLRKATDKRVAVHLPTDVVVATSLDDEAGSKVLPVDAISDHEMALDIGPATIERYRQVLSAARTVFWNGPMGVFEMPAFAEGTKVVAGALTDVDGLSVVGGGDSAAAVRQLGFTDDEFGHISTGGGASLEFLEGKKLPGLEVLGWSL